MSNSNNNTQETLFSNFEKVNSKQWKNLIQYELKGKDYNEELVWESVEGIKVKPFYHADEDAYENPLIPHNHSFEIVQTFYSNQDFFTNENVEKALKNGAESLQLFIFNDEIDLNEFPQLFLAKTLVIHCDFLNEAFVNQINEIARNASSEIFVTIDPIYQLISDGNYFHGTKTDFELLKKIQKDCKNINIIGVNGTLYQNAGANAIQQVSYILAHTKAYLDELNLINQTLLISIAIGENYFFEMAKIQALKMGLRLLLNEYDSQLQFKILATPTERNKTIYDYNVNMLRTTSECMSAVLGGADLVANMSYDYLFKNQNEFGERIARNQLLILKNESYLDKVKNPIQGAYFIESLIQQLAEKSLALFKEIDKSGGLITQLMDGIIQKKIKQSDEKELVRYVANEEILLGTTKFPNVEDKMLNALEKEIFKKNNVRKTLIAPIFKKRLAENWERERINAEKAQ